MSRSSVLFLAVIASCASGSYGSRDKSNGYKIVGSDYREGEEQMYRPCSFKDYDCMRNFISDNSECIAAPKFLPDPINLPKERFYLPVASMIVTHSNAVVTGFKHAFVTEFGVETATGNVVIEVTLPRFNFSGNAYFGYHRKAKDTIAKPGLTSFELYNVSFTAVIPKVYNMKLVYADIHADTHNSVPKYYIAPSLHRSNDPEVKLHFAEFIKNIVTIIKEVFVFHSYLVMTTFIQTWLCNFELDPYANYGGYTLGKCFPETA